jgi:hypothetical protein
VGKTSSRQVDVARFIRQAMSGQAKAIGSESIGFNDLGSSLKVIVVDAANQLGLRQIQLIVGAVDKDASGVEQGPHGTIAENRGLLDSGEKVSRHKE